jgi:putative phage-type endonuclease
MFKQETLSVDALMDKLQGKRVRSDQILSILNNTFSCDHQFSKQDLTTRKETIKKYKCQLDILLKIPKLEQRSDEWYKVRKTLITASEFAQALGKAKFGTQKQFYQKKCGHEEDKTFNSSAAPLKWGIMFEPIACNIYSNRTCQVVHEFGLLRHPTIPYFGASPDGITNNGIMLEIKCPYQRKITGEVPLQYFYQIQGQLSVCELYECDYVECGFKEFDDLDTLLENTEDNQEIGVIVEHAYSTTGGEIQYIYKYSDMFSKKTINAEIINDWIEKNKIVDCNRLYKSISVHYWALDVYNTVRIYRDDKFLVEQFESLKHIWDNICMYRQDIDIYKLHITGGRTTRSKSTLDTSAGKSNGYMFLDE